METGTSHMSYNGHANLKSIQQNPGTILSANLGTDDDWISVVIFLQGLGSNLASAFQRNQTLAEAFTSIAVTIQLKVVIGVSPGLT
jgi:hypothetical protein